ncbi:MAG: hypothetical protein WBC91_01335 [Phototrophicaceae bacterium]
MFTLFNLIYWILYFIALKQHSSETIFWKMPHIYLWITAYLMGLVYIANHFFFLQYFDNVLFANSRYPVFMYLYVTLHFIYMGGGLLVLGNETKSRSITILCWLVFIVYFATLVNTNHNDDYINAYLINTILLYLMSVFSYFALVEINKRKKVIIANTLEATHGFWYVLFSFFWGLSYFINAVNSLSLLINPLNISDYQGNMLAYLLSGISITCVGIMMMKDKYLYYTSYLIRIWQKWKLKKLCLILLKKTKGVVEARNIDHLMDSIDDDLHTLIILILDYYPFLPDDDPLKPMLEKVEAEGKGSDNIIWKIIQMQGFSLM